MWALLPLSWLVLARVFQIYCFRNAKWLSELVCWFTFSLSPPSSGCLLGRGSKTLPYHVHFHDFRVGNRAGFGTLLVATCSITRCEHC